MSVNSNFTYAFFDSIKKTEIIKLKKIMKLYNAIGDDFKSNILRNFHKNAKDKRMIVIVNMNVKFLIFNLNIVLNNISKNIR